MKQRNKRQLLAAMAAMAILVPVGGVSNAATLNGKTAPGEQGTITNQFVVHEAQSSKLVVGQGKLNIQTNGNAGILFNDLKNAIEDNKNAGAMALLNGIRGALTPTEGNTVLVGAVGGESKIDTGLLGILEDDTLGGIIEGKLPGVGDKIINANTITDKDATLTGDIQYVVGSNDTSPVVVGAVGGDLSVNTGANAGTILGFLGPQVDAEGETSITRTGNVNMTINSGNVLGGTGGSAAVTVGNVTGSVMSGLGWIQTGNDENPTKTTTTLNGNVDVTVNGPANLGGFSTGGSAIALGGNATSIITGDASVTIDSSVDLQKNHDGLTAAVAGGGSAISTIGGNATSTVGGDTKLDVTNGLSVGLIGGGAAASVDATGVVELIKGGNIGKNDGSSDTDVSGITVNVNHAIEGGNATADVKGETHINLKGNTTAVGVVGGGLAAASHTYTVRDPSEGVGSLPTHKDGTSYNKGDAYGHSNATATTGKSNITVDLNGKADVATLGDAVKAVIGAAEGGTLDSEKLAGLKGQGMALGVFGGGVAVGHGSASAVLSGEDGAQATATTEGSDIKLNSGYAAAVFGGGAAVTDNNARATAEMTDTVNISTASGMQTVGLFGGGVAISMEGSTAATTSTKGKTKDGNVALSTAKTVNIENAGDTDGIFGGGMAIGNSQWKTEGNDAVSTVETSNITVTGGTVSNLDMRSFMDATKNNNQDGYPWWNRLGYNASAAMVDLKGVLDDTSIVGGGVGMGMTGEANVTQSNIVVNGGTVTKDIVGGGIAIDNSKDGSGAHVGESNITLNGGDVQGSVYAGGVVNGTTLGIDGLPQVEGHTGYDTTNTASTVGNATVTLNGTTVAGEISGQGYKLTTAYANNNYNPYYGSKAFEDISYSKDTDNDEKADVYESVTGTSTLKISGTNTLSALDNTSGKYTSDSKIHDFDTIMVEADSVTTLDGKTVEAGNTALIDGGKVTVDGSAKLDISGLTKTEDAYHIAANTATDSSFWTDDNFVYDRTEGFATGTTTTAEDKTAYDVTYKNMASLSEEEKAQAADSMVSALDAGPLQPTIEDAINKNWDTSKGLTEGGKQFFSDWSKDETGAAYGRAAMIGEDAAVTGNTVSIARDMADNVMQRLSFTDDYVQDAGWVNNDGGIWAKYIHRKYETDSMGSSFGGIHSSTDYDGAIVGVDFAKHGNFQSGVAFHYGSGDGNGVISHNDYDAWGFTLYGSIKDEEAHTNLMADVGYVTSDNDIDGTVAGKSLSADRDVDAWTIGLRGEKEYVFGQNQLVPYVGLRYMSVNPARYSVYYDGAKAFNADADNQNLWLLPIGVSFRNETVTDGGWRITPKLDLSYIWAFGDTDTDMTLDMGGVGSGLYYDVMDDNSWLASLGVEATKDVWSFGVGYGYQKGDDTKNKTWFVNASYAF